MIVVGIFSNTSLTLICRVESLLIVAERCSADILLMQGDSQL
jgi:hypothetical protein